MENRIERAFRTQADLYHSASSELSPLLRQGADLILRTLKGGGKILLCGNGGSAADAQHLAAEFVVRLSAQRDRKALPALALTTDSSILTAASNDFGFASVFSRQVEALGIPGDLLIGLSTSGRSENVLRALKCASGMDIATMFLTGMDAPQAADVVISVPARQVAAVQEMHIFCGHLMIALTEEGLAGIG